MKTPTKQTLRKYGLDYTEWVDIGLSRPGFGLCQVCGKIPASKILHIDHEHVRGWKKMPPSERKKYVRGLLCYTCNRFHLSRGMTRQKALSIAKYLEEYEKRSGKKGV